MNEQQGWRAGLNWISAILISLVFLSAGLWKASDPTGWAVRLTQFKVPQSLSLVATLSLAIAETLAGVLILVPQFRRWGAWLCSLLLIVFMVYIAIHYTELLGQDCSCFPWLKRAVGPQFFVGDGIMLLLAVGAGLWTRQPSGLRGALLILCAVSTFAVISWAAGTTRHNGTKAPATIAGQDGKPISLAEGKILLYFYNPHCMHCLDAGKKLSELSWGDTRFVGVPTEDPKWATWFLDQAGLTGRGPVTTDVDTLKKLFPFDLPPAAVALQDGYQKAMLLQFEDDEPGKTLRQLGFVK